MFTIRDKVVWGLRLGLVLSLGLELEIGLGLGFGLGWGLKSNRVWFLVWLLLG